MKPMLNPKRDLKGATPETLAKALFRPLSGRRGKPVVPRNIPIKQIPADKARNG